MGRYWLQFVLLGLIMVLANSAPYRSDRYPTEDDIPTHFKNRKVRHHTLSFPERRSDHYYQLRASRILGYNTTGTLIRPDIAKYFLNIYTFAQKNCTSRPIPMWMYPDWYEGPLNPLTDQERTAIWRVNSHLIMRCGYKWINVSNNTRQSLTCDW